jgi:hypothetical protein
MIKRRRAFTGEPLLAGAAECLLRAANRAPSATSIRVPVRSRAPASAAARP